MSARNNFDGTSGFELVNREIAFYGFGAVARAVHKLAQGQETCGDIVRCRRCVGQVLA